MRESTVSLSPSIVARCHAATTSRIACSSSAVMGPRFQAPPLFWAGNLLACHRFPAQNGWLGVDRRIPDLPGSISISCDDDDLRALPPAGPRGGIDPRDA